MDSLLAEQYITEQVIKLWAQYRTVFNSLPVNPPTVTCTVKATRTAGFAYYDLTKGVEFNIAYLCSLTFKENFVPIIAHELAHVIQYRLYPKAKQAHGVDFRYIMQSIGFNGNTYHSFSVSKAKAKAKELDGADLLRSLGL